LKTRGAADSEPAELLTSYLADRRPKTGDRRPGTDDQGPRTKDEGPGTDWTDVVEVAVSEHVAPLLFKRLKESDAQASVPADAWQRLRRAYFNNGDRNTRLFRELTTVLQRLRGAGIPVIVLKGAYLAEAVYGDVALRPMCDNDLLVPKADLARAEAVLLDMGGVHKQLKDTESRRRTKHHAPPVLIRDLAIELHWTIVSPTGPVRVDAAGLWDRARPAAVAGVEVLSLSPEDLLLHLCLHFSYKDGCVGLRSLCDVAETIHRFRGEVDPEVRHGTIEFTENWRVRNEPRPSPISVFSAASVVDPVSVPGIDWQQVAERAREWGATRYAGLALNLAGSMLGAAVPAEVLERLVPGGIDPRVLAAAREAVLTQTGRHHWESLFSAQGARSPGEKTTFLKERVFLSRDEMAAKYPASRGSRFFYLYYALRLRDGLRAYTSHALRRARLMMQKRRRERYAALYDWLTRQ